MLGFFPSVTTISAKDKTELQAAEKMFAKDFRHPVPPSWSHSPVTSLLSRWDLDVGSTKLCSLLHAVFLALQAISLITPKTEKKELCRSTCSWILSPSCFLLFLLALNNQYFTSIAF